MKNLTAILLSIVMLVMWSNQTACRGSQKEVQTECETTMSQDEAPMLIDSIALTEEAVQDTSVEAKSDPSEATLDEPYKYLTLNEVELTIPNAVDSIRKALNSFSPEYKDYYYYLEITTSTDILMGDSALKDTPMLMVLGEPYERYLHKFLESHITRFGYVVIDGKEIDFFYDGKDHKSRDFYNYIKKKGNPKRFKYRTDYPAVVDNGISYYIFFSDSALVLKKKIEKW